MVYEHDDQEENDNYEEEQLDLSETANGDNSTHATA